ncbi:PLP-dependent aminotransferase family protein [Actinophytocola oryzae]|uniref:GntR family transcriptional regulator n=1 Tax=Actinophytocola oryzae TaxID=502181 RepID=A0A4R7V078_9PSEU|nr:PLP-dependent aminotransferase family protein [Actinophytocola oryzae]TDV42190.1 GntR family transcriptional regulator [Actinophytocola oryzae]
MPDGHRVAAATLSRLLDGWATTHDETLYLRLAEAMTDLIRSNTLPDGTILPSQRSLAEALGIARGTVTRVYETLAAGDLIEARRGTGSRIRGRGAVSHVTGDARLITYDGHHGTEIDLTSGALPGLPLVVEAFGRLDPARLAVEVATDGYHPKGMPVLRSAVADHYTRGGLPTTPDQILITSGAQHAVWLVAHALVGQGDDVIVEEPTYRGALEAFRHAGGQLRCVPVREEGLDVDHLARLLGHRRPRLLYCQPGVHNPTGVGLSRSGRRRLADLAEHHGVTVVDDTSFAELALSADVAPPLPGAILVGTASKLFWGGLRVGWVRTAPDLVDRLVALRRASDLATPVADQLVTVDLLANAEAARATRAADLRASLDRTVELLAGRVPSWSWQRPAGGTGLWIDTGGNAVTLVEHARRQGVRLVAGPAFSAFNGFSRHVRLPYWHPVELLSEALDRVL